MAGGTSNGPRSAVLAELVLAGTVHPAAILGEGQCRGLPAELSLPLFSAPLLSSSVGSPQAVGAHGVSRPEATYNAELCSSCFHWHYWRKKTSFSHSYSKCLKQRIPL